MTSFYVACLSGGPGGKGALQQTIQEKLPPSHADAGEPDENCERWAGGHPGPPSGAEECPTAFTAEGRRTQGRNGEAGCRAQVKNLDRNKPEILHLVRKAVQNSHLTRWHQWNHRGRKSFHCFFPSQQWGCKSSSFGLESWICFNYSSFAFSLISVSLIAI